MFGIKESSSYAVNFLRVQKKRFTSRSGSSGSIQFDDLFIFLTLQRIFRNMTIEVIFDELISLKLLNFDSFLSYRKLILEAEDSAKFLFRTLYLGSESEVWYFLKNR